MFKRKILTLDNIEQIHDDLNKDTWIKPPGLAHLPHASVQTAGRPCSLQHNEASLTTCKARPPGPTSPGRR